MNITQEGELIIKYPNREDIESLGWKQSNLVYLKGEVYFIKTKYNDTIVLNTNWQSPIGIHNIKSPRIISSSCICKQFFDEAGTLIGEIEIFNGTIKNKQELKKLMEQLNINK